MPIDVLAGLAGAANIGSFVKDLWDFHKDRKSKDTLVLDEMLVQTGDDITTSNEVVTPYVSDIDPCALTILMNDLGDCQEKQLQNVQLQRQAHLNQLSKAEKKAYKEGVRGNCKTAANLCNTAKTHSNIARRKQVLRQLELSGRPGPSPEISPIPTRSLDDSSPSAHVASTSGSREDEGPCTADHCPMHSHEQSDPPLSAGDPFVDPILTVAQAPIAHPMPIELELKSLTLCPADDSWYVKAVLSLKP